MWGLKRNGFHRGVRAALLSVLALVAAFVTVSCQDRSPVAPTGGDADDPSGAPIAAVKLQGLPTVVELFEVLDSAAKVRVEDEAGGRAAWSGDVRLRVLGLDGAVLDSALVDVRDGEGSLDGLAIRWIEPAVVLRAQLEKVHSSEWPLEIEVDDDLRPVFDDQMAELMLGCEREIPAWRLVGVPPDKDPRVRVGITSSDPDVVAISSSTTMKCVGVGSAEIAVEVLSRTASVPVIVRAEDARMQLAGPDTIRRGESIPIDLDLQDEAGTVWVIEYEALGTTRMTSAEGIGDTRCAASGLGTGVSGRITILVRGEPSTPAGCSLTGTVPDWAQQTVAVVHFNLISVRDHQGRQLIGDRETYAWLGAIR